MSGVFHAGRRVRLRVDVDRFRAGDTGRISQVDRLQDGGAEVVLYVCEMNAPGGTRLGAFYADEIEPLD